jgi:hypothetical protein
VNAVVGRPGVADRARESSCRNRALPMYIAAGEPADRRAAAGRDPRTPTDSVTIVAWILPLRTCWICLYNAGWFVINRLAPNVKWETQRLAERIHPAFRALAESGFTAG